MAILLLETTIILAVRLERHWLLEIPCMREAWKRVLFWIDLWPKETDVVSLLCDTRLRLSDLLPTPLRHNPS